MNISKEDSIEAIVDVQNLKDEGNKHTLSLSTQNWKREKCLERVF